MQTALETRKKQLFLGGASIVGLVFLIVVSSSHSPEVSQVAAAATHTTAFRDIEIEAQSVFVFDARDNRVLFEKNANAQLPLASLTKIPLVLAISEALEPTELVTISRQAISRGEGGGLGAGDIWRVRDLIDFTLIRSSNAGAEALAEAANDALRARYPGTPDTDAAVWRMNELAKEWGLTKTYFANSSGLDIGMTQAGALGTASEMAHILQRARARSDLFARTTDPNAVLGPINGSSEPAINTNDALPNIPGLVMGKTGYTELAGGNVAVVFEVGPDHPILVVVLGSSQNGRFEDLRSIIEATITTIAQSP